MAKLGRLIVSLEANTAKFTRGLESVDKRLERFGYNARRITKLAGSVFAGFSLAVITKDIAEINDKWLLMEGRLKLVKREGESLINTQEKLFELSQRTAQSVESTVSFYVQLGRATKNLDVSQQQLLDVTETLNKAIIVSGASTQSASAALFQLQQGLSAGALRGEELNSVMEQTPRIAELIADNLGVTTGELRKMGEQGKLTASTVINAVLGQKDVISKEYSEIPRTVAQNMQILSNEMDKAAKSVSGINKLYNEGVEALIAWVKVYNLAFNPDLQVKYRRELSTLFQMQKEFSMEGRVRGKAEREALAKRIELQRQLVADLNSQVLAVEKLDELGQKQKKVEDDEEKRKQRTKGLAEQNELIIKNLSAHEAASMEILRQHAYWYGNITSVEAYTEKVNELAEQLKKPMSQADSDFGKDIITDNYGEQLARNQEAQEELLRQDREHRQRIVRQAVEEKEELKKLEQEHRDFMLNTTADLFGSLASLVGQGSKKAFERSKKLARAQTIISTYAAAQKAYESQIIPGDPSSFFRASLAAAAAVAAGLARLAAINRTTYGSASGAAASTGAGSFVSAPGPSPVTPGATNAAQGQTFIIITDGTISEGQLDDILDRASQRINEGSQVIIRKDSVQAQEIASAASTV